MKYFLDIVSPPSVVFHHTNGPTELPQSVSTSLLELHVQNGDSTDITDVFQDGDGDNLVEFIPHLFGHLPLPSYRHQPGWAHHDNNSMSFLAENEQHQSTKAAQRSQKKFIPKTTMHNSTMLHLRYNENILVNLDATKTFISSPLKSMSSPLNTSSTPCRASLRVSW